jgi:hypothetical protein
MQTIALTAVPSQNLSVTLDGQAAQINIYQLGVNGAAALYLDLISDGNPILTGRIIRSYGSQPNTRAPFMMVGRRYQPFTGDLLFVDTQASATNPTEDPQPSGLGARWQLLYFSESDLQGAGLAQ